MPAAVVEEARTYASGESPAFETLVGELLAGFTRLPAAGVDAAIAQAQRAICELLGLPHSALWQWSTESPRRLKRTHLHRAADDGLRRNEDAELSPWIVEEVRAGREVVLGSRDELPATAFRNRENAAAICGMKSLAVLPLAGEEGVPLGALVFAHPARERVWTERTLLRLRLAGNIFAGAIVRRRADLALAAEASERRMAEEALRDLSQRLMRAHEEERALLARELHDDLSQRLAVLAIDVGCAELAAGEPAQVERMRSVREGLVRLSEDVHALSYQLHPSILDDLGLTDALEAEGAIFRRRCSASLSTDLSRPPKGLGRPGALCLFRVAQEALNNVARHANARTVRLALRPAAGGWTLSVHDDGVGFDPAAERARRHLGLASMRERVALVDGRLALDSAPGHGTEVVVWVPALEATP